MKKLIFYSLFAFGLCVSMNAPAQGTKPVKLTVSSSKGNPMANALIFLASSPLYRELDENGSTSFRPMPQDTLFVVAKNYIGMIPLGGQENLDICFNKNSFYDQQNPKTTYRTSKLPKFNTSKLYTNPGIESYGTVSMLIKARFPTIMIKQVKGNEYAYLTSSTNNNNSKADQLRTQGPAGFASQVVNVMLDPNDIGAAYISVDGKLYQSLSDVDKDIKLNRLVSITADKPDLVFGKGGNGKVTIITLDNKDDF